MQCVNLSRSYPLVRSQESSTYWICIILNRRSCFQAVVFIANQFRNWLCYFSGGRTIEVQEPKFSLQALNGLNEYFWNSVLDERNQSRRRKKNGLTSSLGRNHGLACHTALIVTVATHPDVALFPRARSPWVLHYPVGIRSICTITNSAKRVIEGSTLASGFVVNTTRI
jgi:hypothetical protein